MIHSFPKDFVFADPHYFTDPFRYTPHNSVVEGARLIMKRIEEDSTIESEFAQGKMVGVLTVRTTENNIGYIAAFSGNISGRSHIEGFVPSIFDLTAPDGDFKRREAEISAINHKIKELTESESLKHLTASLSIALADRDRELEDMRSKMAASKSIRNELRATSNDESILSGLIKESQYEKAEFRRLRIAWDEKISAIESEITEFRTEIESLKKSRASMSETLQDWIFQQYKVHNSYGEESSIAEIFASQGIVPPGGTGECAAPKLLEFAYRNNLEPVAMGEFWYGKSPETAVRTHGHFYPSCTSKCGPLLGYMMRGLDLHSDTVQTSEPIILYQDEDIIVVEKPSGMPSVPGLDGRLSLQEWLCNYHPVHRLDMDTSGVMIFARTEPAAVCLRQQFEAHSINKTYMARINTAPGNLIAAEGAIDIPLSPDYDERPRQKADLQHGKEAHTKYEVIKINDDGTTEILLYPHTGRTHQLRVHCAHMLGLGFPILGDRLYGSSSTCSNTDTRLHLHALSITFRHPSTGKQMSFASKKLSY